MQTTYFGLLISLFSSNNLIGQMIAVGFSQDGTGVFVNISQFNPTKLTVVIPAGKEVFKQEIDDDTKLRSVAISSLGNKICIGFESGKIQIIDIDTTHRIHAGLKDGYRLTRSHFSQSGNSIFGVASTVKGKSGIVEWSFEKEEAPTLKRMLDFTVCDCIKRDGRVVMSTSKGILISDSVNMEKQSQVATIWFAAMLPFSSSKKILAFNTVAPTSRYGPYHINVISVEKNEIDHSAKIPIKEIQHFALSKDGRLVMMMGMDNTVYAYDLKKKQLLKYQISAVGRKHFFSCYHADDNLLLYYLESENSPTVLVKKIPSPFR